MLRDHECLTWVEQGVTRHPLDRPLLLAALADPDADWADRAVGRRDARLLALRCEWFGPWLDATIDCERCAKRLSLRVDLAAIGGCAAQDEAPVVCDGVRFRLPTSRDLAFAATFAGPEEAAKALFARLAIDARVDGWAEERITAVEAALDAADPLAQVTLDVACEHCGEHFAAPLDIGALLWDELAAHAAAVVDDVHALARAYGWSEPEILAMSSARRALYRRRIGA